VAGLFAETTIWLLLCVCLRGHKTISIVIPGGYLALCWLPPVRFVRSSIIVPTEFVSPCGVANKLLQEVDPAVGLCEDIINHSMKAAILGCFYVLLWSQIPVLGQSEFVIGTELHELLLNKRSYKSKQPQNKLVTHVTVESQIHSAALKL